MPATQTQTTIIAQVRQLVPGAQERLRIGGREVTIAHPTMLRFAINGDATVIVEVRARKRLVTITYNTGTDLYDIKITDLSRNGYTIRGEHEIEGVYAEQLGELITSERIRNAAVPA